MRELSGMSFDVSLTGFEMDEPGAGADAPAALDLDEPSDDAPRGVECHCPKCGFVFEVGR